MKNFYELISEAKNVKLCFCKSGCVFCTQEVQREQAKLFLNSLHGKSNISVNESEAKEWQILIN